MYGIVYAATDNHRVQIPIRSYRTQNKFVKNYGKVKLIDTILNREEVGQYDVCGLKDNVHHQQTSKVNSILLPCLVYIEQIACNEKEQWNYECQYCILYIWITFFERSQMNEYHQ